MHKMQITSCPKQLKFILLFWRSPPFSKILSVREKTPERFGSENVTGASVDTVVSS